MLIVTGSTALALRYPDLLQRAPQDLDLLATPTQAQAWLAANPDRSVEIRDALTTVAGKREVVIPEKWISREPSPVEVEIGSPGSSAEILIQLIQSDPETRLLGGYLVPSLDVLWLLKTSHRYLKNSPHFWKTLIAWHQMREAGAAIPERYRAVLKLREKETYAKQRHHSLAQSKEEFFSGDGVTYHYDHDSVHEAVATFERPAYTYYLRDDHDVGCDRAKFEALPMEYRIAGVVEEAAVLAIERSLVPYPGVLTPRRAWLLALSKVCTSITSGWFREFAYENCLDVLRAYPEGYWERFQSQIGTVVKPAAA